MKSKINAMLTNAQDIADWLAQNKIGRYSLIYDTEYGLMVDCAQNVSLELTALEFIPVKFNIVAGDFNISKNSLTNLKNSPRIVHGKFDCSNNNLETLAGGPMKVGSFMASKCNLTSLEGGPQVVSAHYNVNHNKLINLKGSPMHVGGFYSAADNCLTSLEGCPKTISGFFKLNDNEIESLEFFPEKIMSNNASCYIVLENNPKLGTAQKLSSFEDFLEIKAIQKIHNERATIENWIGTGTESNNSDKSSYKI